MVEIPPQNPPRNAPDLAESSRPRGAPTQPPQPPRASPQPVRIPRLTTPLERMRQAWEKRQRQAPGGGR